MGRPLARQPGLWPVVEHRGSGTHQSARTLGSGEDSPMVRIRSTGTQCPCPDGQLDSGSLPEQGGRDKISHPLLPHHETPHMVSRSPDHSAGDSHRGCHEHPCRRSLQGTNVRPHGDIVSTSDSTDNLCTILSPSDRPVCFVPEQTATGVLLSDSRPEGVRRRRSVSGLEGTDGLCLPSNLAASKSGRKGGKRRLLRPAHSPFLAETRVVSTNGRSSCGSPHVATSTSGPAQAGSSRRIPSKRAPTVDCLAIIRQRCQEKGFSRRSAGLVASGRRQSTLKTCSKRLAPYFEWCTERDISPTRADVNSVFAIF